MTLKKIAKYFPTGFFLVGAISMLVMSNHYFHNEIAGVMKGKSVSNEYWYGLSLRVHIVFGLIAIFLGPFQFVEAIRVKFLKIHRRIGYIYAFSVFVSAVSGFVVAQFPMGGSVSRYGFTALSIFWLYSLTRSILLIRQKNIQQHRYWMFINYGLTFAAIPQRTLLLIPVFVNVDFMDIYRLSAWLPWMLNTVIAVTLYNKLAQRK